MDCLIPVYRRLLLSLHEIANKKLTKSAKITGYTSGTYHPHGPQAIYGALISLYKQGFLDIQGNFGSPGKDDAAPSSERYTECKIKKWVDDFCFKYIDYVPWDVYEYEKEPLFISSILPIGLIGDGDIYSGIAFHRCVMPRYKISDLAKRLKYLITGDEKDKVIIYPNFEKDGCTCLQNDEIAESILTTGIGSLTLIPNGEIKNKKLHVYGRVPQTTFNTIREDESVNCKCISGATIDIMITPTRKVEDLETFYSNIYNKHLIKNINFNICVCDDEGKVQVSGVDELISRSFDFYVDCSKYKLIDECLTQIQKKYENEIIVHIRKILKDNPLIKTIDEIVKIFGNIILTKDEYDFDNSKWLTTQFQVTESEIREICSSRNIKALVEHVINIQDNQNKIIDLKKKIENNSDDCYTKLCQIADSDV
jgi:hypothetical protein